MRSRKALINTIFAIILEVVTMISSIIVPRIIIGKYGSDVNGLLTSITQFLGYLTLLESGVGGVVKASLYKPLAEHDRLQISRVIRATEIFFRKIALASVIYIAILTVILPLFLKSNWEFAYTTSLVIIIGINNIAQYYFGMPSQLLIRADQRGYIYSSIQIVSTVLNVIIVFITVNLGYSIQVVKLSSAVVFVARPILLNLYVTHKYEIEKNVPPDNKALIQRWNGVGFSIASFVHKKTDVFLITLFLSLKEVSVYSVYSTIAVGLDAVVSMTTNSFQAAFGNMIAKDEDHALMRSFRVYNLIVHMLSFVLFSVAIVMMISYVKLYSKGITDVNYLRPIFGIILILGEFVFCLRMPYQAVVTAAGHYKQTQAGAVLEAIINILLTIAFIFKWGIVGAAIGTLASMIYRTLDYVFYLSRNIIRLSPSYFFLRILIGLISSIIGIATCFILHLDRANSWLVWIGKSACSLVLMGMINVIFNYLFYKDDFMNCINSFGNAIYKKRT
ncbi:MAG: polysaccharide biosynthesis C-terminal domain-containing protein [Lachnospiraceae bacterium]|nr:polysaccharide biosynthesis C-terminal domain-containing protein [Lachnospiraceae bacterium]